MGKLKVLGLGVLVAAVASGCTAAPSPLSGFIYTDVKYPSYYDGADTTGPGPKTGTAQASSVLGIVATGDSSVAAACRAGGIRKIHTVDQHTTNILSLYATWTTIVTGE